MDLRPYQPADRDACLALHQQPDLADAPPPAWFVLEHEGAIVGCGGYALSPPSARLVGISIRPDARRQGLGRYLLMYCLREIGKAGGIDVVTVEAPLESAGFLESQGFRPAGSATYIKKLTVCA